MASPEQYITITPVPEGSSFYYTGILTQGNGQPIPNGSLVTLKLTITDDRSGAIINSRNQVNALNLNGVTIDISSNPPTGLLVWKPDPADNPLVNPNPSMEDGKYERHTAILSWTWNDGARVLASQRKIFIDVEKYASTEVPIEAGTGPDNVTIYLDDGSGNPNPGVDVWVTSDVQGLVRVSGTLVTNAVGKATFKLTNGNPYYLWTQKAGFPPIQGSFFNAAKD